MIAFTLSLTEFDCSKANEVLCSLLTPHLQVKPPGYFYFVMIEKLPHFYFARVQSFIFVFLDWPLTNLSELIRFKTRSYAD